VPGDNVMAGYLDDPAATAEAIDADGWFHTGDVGWLDNAGNLRITDRIKDLYIAGGFNVYPAEVENVLLTPTANAEAAVIGVPDARMGEVGLAFVVSRAGADFDREGIIECCRARVANFKVPRYVDQIDRLPVNAGGEVTQFTLRFVARAILDGD
jgi:acyl-CoA synthetase (AMP-forming)/AMP-acid ligase II